MIFSYSLHFFDAFLAKSPVAGLREAMRVLRVCVILATKSFGPELHESHYRKFILDVMTVSEYFALEKVVLVALDWSLRPVTALDFIARILWTSLPGDVALSTWKCCEDSYISSCSGFPIAGVSYQSEIDTLRHRPSILGMAILAIAAPSWCSLRVEDILSSSRAEFSECVLAVSRCEDRVDSPVQSVVRRV